jgi:hypothetical protein
MEVGRGKINIYSNTPSFSAFTCLRLYLNLPAFACLYLLFPLPALDCARKRLRARRASVQCRGDVGECGNEIGENKHAVCTVQWRLSGVELSVKGVNRHWWKMLILALCN